MLYLFILFSPSLSLLSMVAADDDGVNPKQICPTTSIHLIRPSFSDLGERKESPKKQ